MTDRGAEAHRVGNGSFRTGIHPSGCKNPPNRQTTTHCLSQQTVSTIHLSTAGLFPMVNNLVETENNSRKNPRLYW